MPLAVQGLQGAIKVAVNDNSSASLKNSTNNFISGLVTSVILGPGDKGYTSPLDIGTVWFVDPKNPVLAENGPQIFKAKPFYPNINQYPLVNEIIYILVLPSYEAQNVSTNINFYYVSAVNLWGSQILNYYKPDLPGSNLNKSKLPNDLVSAGVPNQAINSQTTGTGDTPLTSKKYYKLAYKLGDVSYEGRFGQSINFTSNGNYNPVTIIRNGQPSNLNLPGWDRIPENINQDKGSIYLTEQGQIPLYAGVRYYNSYTSNAPEAPNLYAGNQVILNSGRLVLNSTNDHTLIYGNKSVGLNSLGTLNFDSTGDFVAISPRIFLGTTSTEEPLVKGQTLYKMLDTLLNQLSIFTQACSIAVGVPAGTPLEPINTAAAQLNNTISSLQELLPEIKSKSNYTR